MLPLHKQQLIIMKTYYNMNTEESQESIYEKLIYEQRARNVAGAHRIAMIMEGEL